MPVTCDKCSDEFSLLNCHEVEFHEWKDNSFERTLLCQSCYQSFLVYFDNFMDEVNES